MTLGPSNSRMFFAYHIRSAFLTFESVLQEILNQWSFSLQHFYILRSDWKSSGIAFDDLCAHAIMSKKETEDILTDLITKDYVLKGSKDGLYLLSPLGVSVRGEVLEAYQEHISKATLGLSDRTIEAALSGLLTVQTNIERL